jgi:hypothetical protein
VYEIEVRPRDPTRPGIVGTFALEGAAAGIVRMAFSFTPASYVDPRTDKISVALDYGLWEGRYWLPNEQHLEVRRELPELDLGVGTVIRSVLRTGAYELNVPLPSDFGRLPAVTVAAPAERRSYPFAEGLYEALDRDGLADIVVDPDVRALRAQAQELAARRVPSGLAPVRLHLPRLSAALRFNRAEGTFVGAGLSFRPDPRLAGEALGGWAFGAGEPQGSLALRAGPGGRWAIELRARFRELADLGIAPGSDGLVSSLSGALRGEDFRDPYLATGASLGASVGSAGGTELAGSVGFERARTPPLVRSGAPLDSSRELRPLRPVAEGDFLAMEIALRRALAWPAAGLGRGELVATSLSGDPGSGIGLRGELEGRWGPRSGTRELQATLRGWHWEGDPLPQGHRLLGGRGTVPGYPFRSWAGTSVVQGTLAASASVAGSLVRVRGALHAGWAGGGAETVESLWNAGGTQGVRASASVGVGIAWDLVRIEVARGFSGGEWQLLLGTDPRWWDRL